MKNETATPETEAPTQQVAPNNELLVCECGEQPVITPPSLGRHMAGSDPQKNPGFFYPILYCRCGISMYGEDYDESGKKLVQQRNDRMNRINAHYPRTQRAKLRLL